MDDWEKLDPIPRLGDRVIKEKKATQAELDTIDQEATKEIEDAVAFAKESPSPKPEDVMTYLFVSEK
jgi:pyruvate dehydrogenase E1 component alpha subunit